MRFLLISRHALDLTQHLFLDLANWSLFQTGIFCSDLTHIDRGKFLSQKQKESAQISGFMEQHGVLRTNCVDCLDRTNVGQFAVGVRFLGVALHVLGLSDSLLSEPSNPFVMTLMDMFSDMGDKIALQYGGSEAHSKMGQAGSSLKGSGELLTSIKRYYSNAFTDRVKQDSINLFLGHFIPSESKLALWELESDYHLHNKYLRPKNPYSDEVLLSQAGSRFTKELSESYEVVSAEGAVDENMTGKYLVRQSIPDDFALSIISRKSARRHKFQVKYSLINDAQEEWWRLAIHDFHARKLWMKLSKSAAANDRDESFSRLYKPSALTSFDDLISADEFSNPIVIDSSSTAFAKSTIWTDKKVSDSPLGVTDDSESSLGMLGAVTKFAGQIGIRARNLVGGFLRKEESVEDVLKSKNDNNKVKSAKSLRGSIRCEEDYYTGYVSSTQRIRDDSCASGRLHDFEEALKEFNIDLNDAKSMTQLSMNSHIGYTCKTGKYEGLDYSADAVMVHGSLYSGMVAIEDMLSTNTSFKHDVDLILSDSSRQRLENISSRTKLKTGMELEFQVRASQFLIDQQMYVFLH